MKRKRRTKKRASEPGKAPTLKAQQQKARKLQQLVDDLERGENFNITRLVVIKSLCQDVKTAARFTLHLARLAKERRDWDSGFALVSFALRRLLAFDSVFETLNALLHFSKSHLHKAGHRRLNLAD